MTNPSKAQLIQHYNALLFHLKGETPPVFHDTFAEISDTLINNHTPDIDESGLGWMHLGPTVTVVGSSGYATLSDNGSFCLASTAVEDFEASLVGKPVAEDGRQQIILGYEDVNNMIVAAFDTASHEAHIYKRVGGAWDQVASGPADHTGTASYVMTGRKSGNYYSVDVNGNEVIPATEIVAFEPEVGKVGMRSNTTVLHRYDDFRVVPL